MRLICCGDGRDMRSISWVGTLKDVITPSKQFVRTTTRSLCKVFDRCTIMDIARTVTSNIPVIKEDVKV